MINQADIDFANRLGIPVDIHLISCGMTKSATRAKARDLYTGSTFQRSLQFASTRGAMTDGAATCLIVSALHGLLDMDTEVDPYDQTIKTMTAEQKAEWVTTIRSQLEALGITKANFHVHAGQAYIEILREAVAPFGRIVNFFNPWGDYAPGIGERRGYYRRTRDAEVAAGYHTAA